MTEKAYRFGRAQNLIGIITDPPEGRRRTDLPAIVILNSGLIHRVGPNRLSVRIARSLACRGYTVLRFDFSGIGDSGNRDDNLPFAQSSLVEAREAMDLLERNRNVGSFIFMGICSGADTAFSVALSDDRVVGIAPIDFFSIPSAAYQFREYRRRLLRPRSWIKFLTGRSDLWSILRNLRFRLSAARANEKMEETAETVDLTNYEEFLNGFGLLLKRGVRICLIYSAGSPAYYNFKTLFRNQIAQFIENGAIQLHFLKHSDHGFTLNYNQELLLKTLCEWLDLSIEQDGSRIEQLA